MKLNPLVDAYQDWIEREEQRIADPDEGLGRFQQVAQQAEAVLSVLEDLVLA